MKPSEIKIGSTYYGNNGSFTRTVLSVKENKHCSQDVVFYRERDARKLSPMSWDHMNIDTFAAWAEGEVKP
jgi:hypothetical protein